mmetsp:Transcript_43259/g.85329  ORF Transcript_43259/g.85329 Transcript_43259/m.85329 type:complete len:137 (+) Transcript_43259:74-484(+)
MSTSGESTSEGVCSLFSFLPSFVVCLLLSPPVSDQGPTFILRSLSMQSLALCLSLCWLISLLVQYIHSFIGSFLALLPFACASARNPFECFLCPWRNRQKVVWELSSACLQSDPVAVSGGGGDVDEWVVRRASGCK